MHDEPRCSLPLERVCRLVPFVCVAAYLGVPLLHDPGGPPEFWRSHFQVYGPALVLLPLLALGGGAYLARRGGDHRATSSASTWSDWVVPALVACVGGVLQVAEAHKHPYGVALFAYEPRVISQCVSEALPIGILYGLLASFFFAALAVQAGIRARGRERAGCRPKLSRAAWSRIGLACAGVLGVLYVAGPKWTIAGAWGVLSGISGLVLGQRDAASPGADPRPEGSLVRRRVLWCAALAIVSAGLAMRSILYRDLLVAIAGEAVPPWERGPRMLEAHASLRVLSWAYPILLAFLWLGAPKSSSVPPVEPRPRRAPRTMAAGLWLSTCVLPLTFLYGEADKQMAVVEWQSSEVSKSTQRASHAATLGRARAMYPQSSGTRELRSAAQRLPTVPRHGVRAKQYQPP
jgi:hypothetical protein